MTGKYHVVCRVPKKKILRIDGSNAPVSPLLAHTRVTSIYFIMGINVPSILLKSTQTCPTSNEYQKAKF